MVGAFACCAEDTEDLLYVGAIERVLISSYNN